MRSRSLNPHRRHHAATDLRPVARIDVDVFAPETVRTVVGVASTFYFLFTMLAGEIFYFFDKCHEDY